MNCLMTNGSAVKTFPNVLEYMVMFPILTFNAPIATSSLLFSSAEMLEASMANKVDPDQIGAVCSGSTLFASILNSSVMSDFIWDFRKLPFPSHLGKYFIKIGKKSAKIHEIGKIKAIFELGNDSHIRP